MNQRQEYDRVPDARMPKKHWPALSRVFLSLFGIVLVGGLLAGAAGFYGYQEFVLPGPLGDKKVFIVEKGLSVPEIGATLEENGIISDARVFSAVTYLKKLRGGSSLKAGEYEFSASATMRDVLALIQSGKSLTYKVSVPEGFTSFMALARVLENDVLTGEVTELPAEGAIMPDTYVFKRGLTRQKMIDDMEDAQAKLLDELWAKRNPAIGLKSKEEAVVLASIVEKETGKAEERGVIASVFLNRLAKGMRLQSDPTIIYGITIGQGKLDRPLTRADIKAPTPYNTYTIDGLPPGPIANPGRAALEAVLNPPGTKYLYFVADGSGGHAFAETLDEHNKNVAAWRKVDYQAPATAMEDEPAGEEQQASANTLPDIAEPEPAPAAEPDAPQDGAAAAVEPGVLPEDATADAPAPEATSETPTETATAETKSAEEPAADTATAEPKAVIPKPRDKPKKTVEAETSAPPVEGDLEPGSVIRVGKRLIPIPKNKPNT